MHRSFFKPGYGFINSFVPKYKQGDTVYVRREDAFHRPFGPKLRGKIVASRIDRDMNFIDWQVSVPSLAFYIYKKDPKCPWNK